MGSLTVALLREHKWSYLGAFFPAVLASAIITGSISLVLSSLTMDGVSTEGLDRYAASGLAAASTFMVALGGVTAFVAVIVSVILVSTFDRTRWNTMNHDGDASCGQGGSRGPSLSRP